MFLIIVGGGKIGYYLAKTLAILKHKITVIEIDKSICMNIVNTTSNLDISVINGDGTNINFLVDADIESADAFIAVTGRDQDNLVACQIAKKKFYVKKTVARVNNPKNIKIFEKLGVDSAVSSTSFIVDIIEKEVFISGLRSLTTIGNISINEIKIHSGFSAEDRQIKELQLPKECIIISIIRNNELIIPGGSTILRKDDELIIVLKRGDEKKLEKVFGKY